MGIIFFGLTFLKVKITHVRKGIIYLTSSVDLFQVFLASAYSVWCGLSLQMDLLPFLLF